MVNHGARCNGGAGKLIEFAAFFFNFPAIAAGINQRFAIKVENPVALFQIDLVAEAGGFTVLYNTYASDSAVEVNTDDHGDITAVAVCCYGGNNCRNRLAIVAGDMNIAAFFQSEQIPVLLGYRLNIHQQIIVVALKGNNFQ